MEDVLKVHNVIEIAMEKQFKADTPVTVYDDAKKLLLAKISSEGDCYREKAWSCFSLAVAKNTQLKGMITAMSEATSMFPWSRCRVPCAIFRRIRVACLSCPVG